MIFNINPVIENNVVTITTTANQPTPLDLAQEEKFGSFTIDAGGDFIGNITFTLPPRLFTIRPSEEFVAIQKFFLSTDADAQNKANIYGSAMMQRILLAKADFDGDQDITNPISFSA